MTQAGATLQAFFLDGTHGKRFCLLHTPPSGQPVRGHVVYVHPFAEEMNATRRMAAKQARAMARAGFAVLQMDLMGCGDSSGHFEEASWETWVADVALARRWMLERWPGVAWLWGVRAGCLLAAQACRQDHQPPRLLLWQPVLSGKQHLQQFLRLQMAGDVVRGESSRGTAHLVHLLEQGESVEVAGYRVSAALAQGLARADLEALPADTQVVCLELGDADSGTISPALSTQMQRWQNSGCHAQAEVVAGSVFWQIQETADSPAWLSTSLRSLGCATSEVAS
ncbi:hydrolase 2, exosortase A system-associated [Rhodoferax fermentans]|uniref:Hydrolase 2, exosortase A system-associated n=1 Tax=Rhodoferax fermentans TaxID=28066 RepID=A0A1T1ATB8_RHOFE|nr:hydrolase 2, exosortase A system-associated [Rhodoferax fermentans]MBK1682283.1 hydrolase 2, exosortase A system-associated [Rhodoferax fermentans]OOV07263.1 hydrolase 2, exosortase A system-associated [Rhodoferax fermentans]